MDVFAQINWVDIFVVLLVVRVLLVAAKGGVATELFKLPGTAFSIYLALHYNVALATAIKGQFSGVRLAPVEFFDFLCLVFLAAVGYYTFALVRISFCRFVKLEALPRVNRWAGLILGTVRAVMFVGFMCYTLTVMQTEYFTAMVRESFFGRYAFSVAPGTYRWIWDNVTSRFMTGETYNPVVEEVEHRFRRP